MKNILFTIVTLLIVVNSLAQCIEIDISVTRQCTEGQGVLTILDSDIDSVTYSIDGGVTFINTPQFSNLNVGIYSIVVKDTTGCVVNLTAEIEAFLEVGPLSVTTSCATPSGIIDIRGLEGKPLYQYSFDGGASFYNADSIKTELASGDYNVVIKDSYGCEIDTLVTVDAYPTISPTILPQNELCNGSGPGTVDITFTDGATYDYSLNGGAITSGTAYNNANLVTGFYVIDITDVNNCTSPFQFEVGADLVDDSVQINHEYCHYGDATLEFFGFLGQAPYEYSIDNGTTYLASGLYSGLAEGDHIVFIKDATGCVKKDTVYVTNFGGIVAVPSLDDTVCLGSNAIVSVSHNGGVNSNYNWNNGLGNLQSHVVSPMNTTTYVVIVTDSYGCKDTVESIITVETIPNVSLSENQVQACIGDEIQIQAFGALTYQWSNGDNTDVMTYIVVGNETITVIGSNGQCTASKQIVIIIKPSPTAEVSANTTSINTGDSIFFSSNGSVTSTTTWAFGDGFSSLETQPYHHFDFPGAYMVILTTEMGGCETQDSILVYVGTVGVNENTVHNILVYPNPAREFINVTVAYNSQIEIYNTKGKLVSTKELREGENNISIENLSKGIYIAVVKSDKHIAKQFRLMIQ